MINYDNININLILDKTFHIKEIFTITMICIEMILLHLKKKNS